MEDKSLFYQESGKANPVRTIISFGIATVLTFFLGYIYNVIVVVMPIIYVNFLMTTIFGLSLGLLTRLIVRTGHNRNKKSQYILAIILGLLANYFQWTSYILWALEGKFPAISTYVVNLYWIIIPADFFAIIGEINKVGMWQIFGIQFNGLFLALIWIFEALIIIMLPISAIYKTKIYPYSELLGKWYPKITLSQDFESMFSATKIINQLQGDVIETISGLKKGIGTRHSKLHLFYLHGEENQYFTIENVTINREGKKDSEIILNNYRIKDNEAQSIIKKFEAKKENIDVI